MNNASTSHSRTWTIALALLVIAIAGGAMTIGRRPSVAPNAMPDDPRLPIEHDNTATILPQQPIKETRFALPPERSPKDSEVGPSVTVVWGSVFDQRGTPIEGAAVYLRELRRVERGKTRRSELSKTVFTDRTGQFRVTDLEESALAMMIVATGYVPEVRRINILTDCKFTVPPVILRRGTVLQGRVVTESGDAVSNACIQLLRLSNSVLHGIDSYHIPLAVTDHDGAFLATLASDEDLILVECPGFNPVAAVVELDRPLQVVLKKPASISGVIRGGPPSGLYVQAIPIGPRNLGSNFESTGFTAVETTGIFAIFGIDSTLQYSVCGYKQSEGERFSRCTQPASGVPGQTVDLEYVQDTIVRATLCVERGGRSPKPILLMNDERLPMQMRDIATMRDHVEVRASINAISSGPCAQLAVVAHGYDGSLPSTFAVTPGADIDLGTVRMTPHRLLTVRLLDSRTDGPVSNAKVTSVSDIGSSGQMARASDATSLTDVYGFALVRALDTEATVIVEHPFYAVKHVTVPPDRQWLNLSLDPAVSLRVRVCDSAGERLADQLVECKGVGNRLREETDSTGTAVFSHVAAGEYVVTVSQPLALTSSFMLGDSLITSGVVQRGDTIDATASVSLSDADRDLTVYVPTRHRISGRISQQGRPLVGATVTVVSGVESRTCGQGQSLAFRSISDSSGGFAIGGLPDGLFSLRVKHPSLAVVYQSVVVLEGGDATHDVDIIAGEITGSVRNECGEPLAGVRMLIQRTGISPSPKVIAKDAHGTMYLHGGVASEGETVTDSKGTFRFQNVMQEVDFLLRAEGEFIDARHEARVFALEPDRYIEMRVTEGGSVEVRALGLGGPRRNCWIIAECNERPSVTRKELTDINGVVLLRGLPVGRWLISAETVEMDERTPPLRASAVVGVTMRRREHTALFLADQQY